MGDSIPASRSVANRIAERLREEMRRVVVGQDELVDMLIIALMSGGHILLEGVPGTAKTLAVRAFARVCGTTFSRVQFTPDLMPSDIVGTNVFDPRSAAFALRPGPIFAGLVLADEVNRTPPKTQSALLEAMEERRVTVDGVAHALPDPFIVCATQNPIEYEGTYPLPEAQLDRFALKVIVGYPSLEEEQAILERYEGGFRAADLDAVGLNQVVTLEDLAAIRICVAATRVSEPVRRYIVEIARAGRAHRRLALGPSPRSAITLMMSSKAMAATRDRDFVTPDDVKSLALPVLRHRVLLRPESEVEGWTTDRVLADVLETVSVPR